MIGDLDFAKMYAEHYSRSTFKRKAPQDWDIKASGFNERVHNSPYVNDFISRMNLDGAKSLLDVGCGPGTLVLPLSKALKSVTAIDFSQNMIDILKENIKEQNAFNIDARRISWDDAWEDLGKFDIVIASRSMEVPDLKAALQKLDATARKKVYLTYKIGGSYVDGRILEYIGRKINPKPDYFYVLAILYNLGIRAKVDFIECGAGKMKYENAEAFAKEIEWSLNGINDIERFKLFEFYEEYIAPMGILEKKNYPWAFVSWEKED